MESKPLRIRTLFLNTVQYCLLSSQGEQTSKILNTLHVCKHFLWAPKKSKPPRIRNVTFLNIFLWAPKESKPPRIRKFTFLNTFICPPKENEPFRIGEFTFLNTFLWSQEERKPKDCLTPYYIGEKQTFRIIEFFSGISKLLRRTLRWRSQRIKINRLASGYSKDFSNPGLHISIYFPKSYIFFAIHKYLTKVLEFWLSDSFHWHFQNRQVWIFIRIFVFFKSISWNCEICN